MSAWWLFSALGFYPVNPSSTRYIVGSPFFNKVTINLPGSNRQLVISAPGAATKPYVKSLKINGREVLEPVINHSDIVGGGLIDFEMSEKPEAWGSHALL